jgi:type 1 fimbria pilin
MSSRQRLFTLAAAALCLAATPAAAGYKVFYYGGDQYTDVFVNGEPQSLVAVRTAERLCHIQIDAGQWWMDKFSNIGLVGGPAIVNLRSCAAANGIQPARPSYSSGDIRQPQRTQRTGSGTCTFFAGGSVCSW